MWTINCVCWLLFNFPLNLKSIGVANLKVFMRVIAYQTILRFVVMNFGNFISIPSYIIMEVTKLWGIRVNKNKVLPNNIWQEAIASDSISVLYVTVRSILTVNDNYCLSLVKFNLHWACLIPSSSNRELKTNIQNTSVKDKCTFTNGG